MFYFEHVCGFLKPLIQVETFPCPYFSKRLSTCPLRFLACLLVCHKWQWVIRSLYSRLKNSLCTATFLPESSKLHETKGSKLHESLKELPECHNGQTLLFEIRSNLLLEQKTIKPLWEHGLPCSRQSLSRGGGGTARTSKNTTKFFYHF